MTAPPPAALPPQFRMTLNSYLFAQAAVVTGAVAQTAGLSLGEWIGLASVFLVIAGVVYKAGVASQKATNVESAMGGKLETFSEKLDKITEFVEATQELRIADARWQAEIEGRVTRLEGDPVHVHQRASDRS